MPAGPGSTHTAQPRRESAKRFEELGHNGDVKRIRILWWVLSFAAPVILILVRAATGSFGWLSMGYLFGWFLLHLIINAAGGLLLHLARRPSAALTWLVGAWWVAQLLIVLTVRDVGDSSDPASLEGYPRYFELLPEPLAPVLGEILPVIALVGWMLAAGGLIVVARRQRLNRQQNGSSPGRDNRPGLDPEDTSPTATP